MRTHLSKGAYAVAVLTAIALGSSLCAAAAPANPYASLLTCSSYTNSLVAAVAQQDGLYHYEYVLDFANTYASPINGSQAPLTTISVGNLANSVFFNAGNDAGMIDPIYGVTSNNSLIWKSNEGVVVGRAIRFWYDSYQPYQEVSATMLAGRVASGVTLGMTPVPEPGSFVAVGAALLGLGGNLLRRRIC